jgi:D-lactate dehydrogenase
MKNIAHFDVLDWEKEILNNELQDHNNIYLNFENTKNSDLIHNSVEILSVFVHHKINGNILKKFPNLELIVTRSTGFDHINPDDDSAKAKKLTICNVPQYGTETVAEHAFALLLSLAKNISVLDSQTKKLDLTYHDRLGFDLKFKNFLVIGAGKIGINALEIAKGFEMKLFAYDVFQNQELANKIGFEYLELNEALTKADIISIHTPYNQHTKDLLNEQALTHIKKGAVIINTARGKLLKNKDLINMLDQKKIAGIGLDTIEDEELLFKGKANQEQINLINRENVIFTPHSAYYTKEAVTRILVTTAENIKKYLQNEIQNEINLV